MNLSILCVKEFFYKDNSQPGFSFHRHFPISLLENQKNLTGQDWKYSNSQYLHIGYIYKIFMNVLKNSVIFEETQRFIASNILDTPIIFPQDFLSRWKTEEFPKLKEILAPSEYSLFEEYLTHNLEKAYLFSNHSCISHTVWNQWFEKFSTYEDLYYLISYNIEKFELAVKNGFGKPDDLTTLDWMAEFFNLNAKEFEVLKAFYFEEKENTLSSIISHAQTSRYVPLLLSTDEQIDFFADVYGVARQDIISFFKNKALLETGLIQNVLKGETFFNELALEKKSMQSIFFGPKFLTLLLSRFEQKEDFINTLIHMEKDSESLLELSNYDYLNPELDSIVQCLSSSSKPVDILFWGKPGTGKTELVKALVKHFSLSLCNVVKFDPVNRDQFLDNQRLFQLTCAKNFSHILSQYIILVDEAEDILTNVEMKHILTEQLENKKVSTVWIVNQIENIHPAFLRRFDYILEINGMPFLQRKKLALELLGNDEHKDLAYKIAQSMHTPAEIISSVEWCHKTKKYTWENVLIKISGYQKALSGAQKNVDKNYTIEIIPPELNMNKGLKNFAGYQYVHQQANRIKDIFNHPEKYQKIGAKVPKGILLTGDSGVGKTLFAKCLANEISIPIIKADCSSLATYPGAISELFEQARSQAPCMVFLDEIDVIASCVVDKAGVNTEKQKLLNQLLVQMDGFNDLDGVMVMGATHRSAFLDSSITRSGRFGETIYFRSPSYEDRFEIWKYYTQHVQVKGNVNYDILSKLSSSMSAADIAQCVNLAALHAALDNQEQISQLHFENACNQLFWGTDAQGLPITKMEQWRTAVHEAGHALIALKNKKDIKRITIRPHMNFLGAVDLDTPEGNHSTTLSQIKQQTEIFFGGMFAEEVVFGHHANGVTSDLCKASSFLMDALLSYGMSSTLGAVVMTSNSIDMSESRKICLENEHKKILDESQNITRQWLLENKQLLIDLASFLLEKRSLSQSELYEWFNSKNLKSILHKTSEECSFEELIAMARK